MTVNAYRLGSLVTLTGRFYSDAAKTIPADPTTVTLTIRDPTGATTSPAVTNAAVGIRTYAWTPTLRGMHDVRWVGTGAVVSADQEAVFVLEDFTLGADLTTVANVKAAIVLGANSSDPLIQDLITAASKAIYSRFQREFSPTSGTPTRRFRVDGNIVDLAPYDLQSVSGAGIVLDPAGTPSTLVAGTDYKLKPQPSLSGTYYKLHLANSLLLYSQTVTDYGYSEVDITGTWGFPAIPVDVSRACILTVAAWLDRGADMIAGMDSTTRPDGSTMTTSWAIPTAAYRLLQPYARVTP